MYKRLFSPGIFLLFLAFISFSSCDKSTDIGINLIPDEYILDPNSSDTFKVQAYTYLVDSVVANGKTTLFFGSYTDPVMGDVTASIITEMRPGSKFDKGTAPVFDSIFLFLEYDTTIYTYGNRNFDQQINIYEIKKRLDFDTTYYNDFDISSLNPELITSTTFKPSDIIKKMVITMKDTIPDTTYTNFFSIRLNDALGQRLLDNSDIWMDSLFVKYFHGLLLTSNTPPVNGSISAFNLVSPNSKVVMHYHKNDTTPATFNFHFGTWCTRINILDRPYNNPGFLADLENPESKEDSVVYIQGTNSLEVRIKFPHLDKLKNEGIYAVNRAELIIQTENSALTSESGFPAPDKMILLYLNSDGKYENLSEFYSQTGYLGSEYEKGKYVFDITYVVQKIVKGDKANNGFVLMPVNNFNNPARAVLTGGNHSRPMKLRMVLTRL